MSPRERTQHLIGIDIGTTGAKALLMSSRGTVVATHTEEYALHLPKPGWAEQNPHDWVDATVRCVRALLARTRVAPQSIAGIGLSGQMHGLVCLDVEGAVLRPAILWCDQRTTAQCRAIEAAAGGRAALIRLTSNPALEGFTLPKLLWVRDHEPALYRRTARVLLPKDFVRFRLTGDAAMDLSDAAGTLMLDVRKGRWSSKLLALVGVKESLLPRLGESPEIAAPLLPSMARIMGLPDGVPVVFGGADNTCAAIGSGAVAEGIVVISVGTSGTVIAPTARPVRDPQGRVHTFNHSVPGLWYTMGVMQAAGLSLKWWRDEFGGTERAAAKKLGGDAYDLLTKPAASVVPGCEGLTWLPYLNGERTPHLDAFARGVLFGVTPRHTKAHVIRAVMEGMAFGLRDSAEIICGLGVRMRDLRLTGGGAKGAVFRQILADALGEPLKVLSAQEGPALGAAVLAGIGTGVFSGFESISRRLVKVQAVVKPNRKARSELDAAYRRYQRLYGALRGEFEAAARGVQAAAPGAGSTRTVGDRRSRRSE